MIKIKLNNYDENVDKLSNKIKTLVIDNQTSINILGQESKKNSVYNYQENLRMVREMRNKNNRDFLKDEIRNAPTFLDKIIRTRKFLNPQSGCMLIQEIILKDLEIGPPVDNESGDGEKSGINYEIKVSVHAVNSKINFVQIRPHHNNHYYILVAYNLLADEIGRVHIFKVPANKLYELLPQYGGYAHRTRQSNGDITKENIKKSCNEGTNHEYALRPEPNGKKTGKPYKLWRKLLEYEVIYNKDNF